MPMIYNIADKFHSIWMEFTKKKTFRLHNFLIFF